MFFCENAADLKKNTYHKPEWSYNSIDHKHQSSSIKELFPTSSKDMELNIWFPISRDQKIKSILQLVSS